MKIDKEHIKELLESGKTLVEIAQSTGAPLGVIRVIQKRFEQEALASDSDLDVAAKLGTDRLPDSYWLKTKSISAKYTRDKSAEAVFDALGAVKEFFDGFSPSRPETPEAPSQDRLSRLNLFPMADTHFGMLAWGEETGEDYDLTVAEAQSEKISRDLILTAPEAEEAILLFIGDTLHVNDQKNRTPASGHELDADGRVHKIISVALRSIIGNIEAALTNHNKVSVEVLPGNHDLDLYLVLSFSLQAYYRNEPRVNIENRPGDFYIRVFGKNMICANHGHKTKPERLVMDAAAKWPEAWGSTQNRVYFTGHFHHAKVQEVSGMTWEQVPAFCQRDAYAASGAYNSKPGALCITYDENEGEIVRRRLML